MFNFIVKFLYLKIIFRTESTRFELESLFLSLRLSLKLVMASANEEDRPQLERLPRTKLHTTKPNIRHPQGSSHSLPPKLGFPRWQLIPTSS